jgi:hypothetical protein
MDAPSNRATRAMGTFHWCLTGLLATALAALYARSFWIRPYGDDLLRIANASLHGFDIQYEFYKYRPIERLITAANVSLFGLQTYLGTLAGITGLYVSSFAVWKIARYFRPTSRAYPLAACAFFAFHSINASAVFQIDTLSQQFATVFCLLAFYWYLTRSSGSVLVYHGTGSLLLLLSLLSKEVAAGAVLAIPVAAACARRYSVGPGATRFCRDIVLGLCGALLMAAIFTYLWQATGGISSGPLGRGYHLALSPTHGLKNLAMMFGSTLYLGSTVDVLAATDTYKSLFAGGVTLVFLALSCTGFVVAARTLEVEFRDGLGWLGAIAVVALGASLPFCIAGSVSELYAYLIVPFVALGTTYFIDVGLREVIFLLRLPPPWFRLLGTTLLLGYAVWMGAGTLGKLSLAERIGERSMAYLDQIVDWQKTLPEGEHDVCIVGDYSDNHTNLPNYSVFVISTESLLRRVIDGYCNLIEPKQKMIISGVGKETCSYAIRVSGQQLQFYATS